MKTSQLKLVWLVVLLFGALTVAEAKPDKKTATFSVSMHCEGCKQKIERNLAYEKGILDLDVNLEKKTVTVTYNAAKTDVQKITDALKKLGYEVKLLPEKENNQQKPVKD